MKIILALLIFSLIVLFHEFGHFLLAKRGGIGVTEFSLGMGPRLFSKQIGETRYSVKLLPFGGSCMMVGEDGESNEENSFGSKSVWTRISVVAAGPIFNFILAFFLSLFIVGSIGYDAPDIVAVMDGYPAAEAGMQPGDRIVQMNKTHIHVYREVSLYMQMHQGETVTVTYERNDQRHAVTLEPKMSEYGTYLLGFQGSGMRTKGNIFQTIYYSAYEVKYWISTTLKSLAMMFQGQVSADDISGPVGIVNTIGETYEASKSDGGFYVWLNMLNISILLSANLGVMNLLPIPALDGGRIFFVLVNAVIYLFSRRSIPAKYEGYVHTAGFLLLIALMVVVAFHDVWKIFFA